MNRKKGRAFRILSVLFGLLGLIFFMLYMGGFLTPGKIDPQKSKAVPQNPTEPGKVTTAAVQTITEYYEAVGTVRPRTEINIEAQVTGRIVEILVGPGDSVPKEKLLVLLDSREFQARLDQARQGLLSVSARKKQARQAVIAAQARYDEARSAFKRVEIYHASEAATVQDLEKAESAFSQARARLGQAQDGLREAEADVQRAEKVVEEAKIALGYTRILASEGGEVVKRLAEPGDLAWPGKPLVVIQTRSALRLEALVREGLIHKISVGEKLQVMVTAANVRLTGTVEEVVPSADPLTRTFLVKVDLPHHEGLFPGMFGRLLVPIEEQTVILVPTRAVKRIGQLELVTVQENGRWEQVFIKTGRKMGDQVEVLSGLQGNEKIALEEGHDA